MLAKLANLNKNQKLIQGKLDAVTVLRKGVAKGFWQVMQDGVVRRLHEGMQLGDLFVDDEGDDNDVAGPPAEVVLRMQDGQEITLSWDDGLVLSDGYSLYDLALAVYGTQKEIARTAGLCEYGFKAEDLNWKTGNLDTAIACMELMGQWHQKRFDTPDGSQFVLYRKENLFWKPYSAADMRRLLGSVLKMQTSDKTELYNQMLDNPNVPCSDGVLEDGKLPVRNGILNLRTGELEEDGDTFFTFRSIAKYDPNAKSELVDKLFYGLAPETVKSLLRMAAYWLMPHQKLKSFFYMYGEGDTGKSTVTDIFKLLLFGATKTPETASVDMLSLFTPKGSAHAWEPLLNARVAIGPEAASIHIPENDILKGLTGGDLISVNPKGKPIVSVTLPVKFVLNSNHAPRFADKSGATAKRLRLIDMTRYTPLEKKWDISGAFMKDEAFQSALLNRLIEAWRELDTVLQSSIDGVEYNVDELFPITEKAQEMLTAQENANFPLLEYFDEGGAGKWLGWRMKDVLKAVEMNAENDGLKNHNIRSMGVETFKGYLKKMTEDCGWTYTVESVRVQVRPATRKDGSETKPGLQTKEAFRVTVEDLPKEALWAKVIMSTQGKSENQEANDNWLRKNARFVAELEACEQQFGKMPAVPMAPGRNPNEEAWIQLRGTVESLRERVAALTQERDKAFAKIRELRDQASDPYGPF